MSENDEKAIVEHVTLETVVTILTNNNANDNGEISNKQVKNFKSQMKHDKHYENEIAQVMVTQSIDENNQVKIFPNVIPTKAQTSIVTIILSTVVTVFILMLTFMFIFWKWKKGRALQNMPTHEEIYLSEFYLDR